MTPDALDRRRADLTAEIEQPRFRVIWMRGRGATFGCGEARYYGWRFYLAIGPLTVLCGRALPDDAQVEMGETP